MKDPAWDAYMAWVRQFSRDYAAACRASPHYQLSEHTHDFDEAQELHDMKLNEMGMGAREFHSRGFR